MHSKADIVTIKAVHDALEELAEQVVFVGGATVSLYAQRQALEFRPTDDVDILIEIYSRAEYIELEQKLRNKGFAPDSTASFVGRFTIDDKITVDVMPTLPEILGFSNPWYPKAFAHAIKKEIEAGVYINIFTAPYFIASKLEAFKSRGKNQQGELDGRFSQDLEDIVFVFEHRTDIFQEMNDAEPELRKYLREEFTVLMNHPYFEEWLDANASYASPRMVRVILYNIHEFIEGNPK